MSDVTTQRFVQMMDMQGGKEKIAQATSNYIRDKLREDSFLAQILPPEDVTPDDCQVSTEHDTLVKIVEVEQEQSVAMRVTFRGGASAEFIRAPRVAVPFYTIMSPMFEKTEQELLAYQMPLTKLVERTPDGCKRWNTHSPCDVRPPAHGLDGRAFDQQG
jgi:hypothetical protein